MCSWAAGLKTCLVNLLYALPLFYNNHRLQPHSQVRVIFLVPQYSLSVLLSQQESGDKRLPFFFCCMFHFYSTCFEWASLICPVTTQLLKECISSRIGLPTYTPVQQSTFLRLLRLLLYIPGGFPALLSLTVFCTFRCFLRHASAYTSCHYSVRLIPAKFFGTEHCLRWKVSCFFLLVEHTRGLSSLTRKKEMPFRMWPVGVFWCEVRLMIIELISLKQVTSHLLTASPGELFWEC